MANSSDAAVRVTGRTGDRVVPDGHRHLKASVRPARLTFGWKIWLTSVPLTWPIAQDPNVDCSCEHP